MVQVTVMGKLTGGYMACWYPVIYIRFFFFYFRNWL